MIEFYPQIRLVHILAVSASGVLFLLRGLGLFIGPQWSADWAMTLPVRLLS
jgi:hypothetical protein